MLPVRTSRHNLHARRKQNGQPDASHHPDLSPEQQGTGSTAANRRKPSMMAMRVCRKLVAIRSNGRATYRIASAATATMRRGAV